MITLYWTGPGRYGRIGNGIYQMHEHYGEWLQYPWQAKADKVVKY